MRMNVKRRPLSDSAMINFLPKQILFNELSLCRDPLFFVAL